jgi:hypothetical protein
MTSMYSWEADKRANKALILHHIGKALERRAWIEEQTPKKLEKHCTYSVTVYHRDKVKSIKQLARDSLDYHRLRAFLGLRGDNEGGSYCPQGWPWDRPANELWNQLLRSN